MVQVFLVIVAALVSNDAVSGFLAHHHPKAAPKTRLDYYPQEFERAVECAENTDSCSVQELFKLANELDEYQGCIFETKEADCLKEQEDRHDVAEILRMAGELKLRQDSLKNSNLFKEDVTQASAYFHYDFFTGHQ